ncbi:MAG TPA: hypothetical protein VL832_26285, partial [Puia sp.]|nr:hypothetical protein [Puia sp.]
IQGLHHFYPDISSADHYNKSFISGCKYKHLPAITPLHTDREDFFFKGPKSIVIILSYLYQKRVSQIQLAIHR